jgi:transposase-like protein
MDETYVKVKGQWKYFTVPLTRLATAQPHDVDRMDR